MEIWLGVLLSVVDLLLKARLKNYKGQRRLKFITIVRLDNYGALLGFMSRHPLMLKALTVISLGYLIMLAWLNYWVAASFRLAIFVILAGAISNGAERLVRGYVIDYFRFNQKKSPVFNLGDIYIFAGSIALIYVYFAMGDALNFII